MGKKIGCAAPTGRAAKRLTEMTGIEAKTLHRLLEFDPATMGFQRDRDNPLPYSAIIVDEVSMLDLFMAYSLMKAVPKNCQLLLVGDSDQLPSVGAGNVLKDLIESEQIKVIKLTQVFRQAVESGIISAAYQINQGQFPDLEPISMNPTSDCLWHVVGNSPTENVSTICELIKHFIPQTGFNPVTDVQVLSPMTRGEVGTSNLNRVLQELINPPNSFKKQLLFGGMVFRERDRVMQLKNDYNREVFNGDLGIVTDIDLVEKEITVEIDGREVKYDGADLLNLTLAWATSIHKSQGSEYPVVILPISTGHRILLSRNLLYTGLTRAKKLAIIVGSRFAIEMAVNQIGQQQRYTRFNTVRLRRKYE